jgi:hypothetical protein
MTDTKKLGFWMAWLIFFGGERLDAQITNAPIMSLALSDQEAVISWDAPNADFVLLESANLWSWYRPGLPVLTTNSQSYVSIPLNRSRRAFFRVGRHSSAELIQQGLANGDIDEETALIYKVYATFEDRRLPEAFRGDDTLIKEGNVMREVTEKFQGLSVEAQTVLQPFRIPPANEGSWWFLRESEDDSQASSVCGIETNRWNFLEFPSLGRSGRMVRVWWPKGKANWSMAYGGIQKAVQKIWPDLTLVMGNGGPPREPLSDGAESCNGDGDAFDIYIVRESGLAECVPYGSGTTPAYILWPALGSPEFLAHELMHAIQFTYPEPLGGRFGEWHWWLEATAMWAIDYIYGNSFQAEHESAPSFLNRPELPLETVEGRAGGREYGAYLWPFYLTRKFGNPFLIPETWERSPGASSLDAIAAVLPEGHSPQSLWPEFARFNWNLSAMPTGANSSQISPYTSWDDLQYGARPQGVYNVRLTGLPEQIYELPARVPPRAAFYYYFEFKDLNVRSVAFFNPFTEPGSVGSGTPTIQALVKIEGEDWEVQNWTGNTVTTFCRDMRSERLEELVVIISNSAWGASAPDLNPAQPARLMANNLGCWRWTGTFSGTKVQNNELFTEHESWTATATFERIQSSPVQEEYALIGGSGNWQKLFSADECSFSYGPAEFTVPPVSGTTYLRLNNFFVPGPPWNVGGLSRRYGLSFLHAGETSLLIECPDGYSVPTPYSVGITLLNKTVPANGIIEGADAYPHPEGTETQTWRFTPVRQ